MATIIEWQLPYTWGEGIEITANKVIKVLLREENNLIEINNDNELYTDLQLNDWIEPSDEFPVGVTVGKVLEDDWWSQNWLLLNWKTTSWDYARWLYGADWKIYFDWGTGTFDQVYYSSEVDALFNQLATVAFTWDYNDLKNRPEIVNPNDWELTITRNWTEIWTFTANQEADETINIEVPTTVAELTDASDYAKFTDLATVATTWDYDDLLNKPTIPVVNDGTLTVQKNWTTVATFTANSSTNQTANITVPTTVAELTDSGDYVTDSELSTALWDYTPTADLAAVALSNSYNDLDNKPTIWDATITLQKNGSNVDSFKVNATSNKNINLTLSKSDVWLGNVDNTSDLNKPISTATQSALNLKANSADLATVATTGDYDDLLDKPNLATVATSGSYNDLSNKPTIPSVINNVTSTDTSNALSAAQGKVLQDQIDDLKALGKFLSLWDATTWLPISFPEAIPYTYSTWDYYLVETVWATNYRPTWSSYTGTASTTVETDELEVWDLYIYDWQIWLLQINHGKTVSFANLTGQPSDNAALDAALDAKADVSSLATVATTWAYSDLSGKPSLATVATSWSYSDLSNKPTIWNATLTIQKNSTTIDTFTANATSNKTINIPVPTTVAELSDASDYAELSDLAAVATSWAYSDLTGTPTLATVATSWSYNDLSNKPTIWTANLKIQKNWTDVATFWANATTAVTANITVPTKTSDLTNDSNFVASTSLATVATSGSYSDLSNKPTVDTAMSDSSTNAVQNKVIKWYVDTQISWISWATVSDAAYASSWNWVTGVAPSKNAVYDKINAMDTTISWKADSSSLATVATSGSYNDLSNKPTIPTVSDAAYGSGWDGVTTIAPSKNAVYDKISAMDTTISGKQDALTTQTAYTAVGSSHSVPQITTNSLWQVTGITEVEIWYPQQISDAAYSSSWNWVTTTAPTQNAMYDKISAMDTTIAWKQATLVSGTNIKTINWNSLLGSWNISVWWISNNTTWTTTTVTQIWAWTESEYSSLSSKNATTIYFTY